MRLRISFICVCVHLGALLTNACDDGWVTFGSSCYLFDDDIKMHFVEGAHFCASTHGGGAYLTTIESAEELLFLQDMSKRLFKHDRNNFFFLGATDDEVEGVWRWYTDHRLVSSGYQNWAPGQPQTGTSQNCAVLWGPSGYLWEDHYCEENAYIICEKPDIPNECNCHGQPEIVG
ncbi:perlucin-like [Mya arenaria]|uniref:perlucin-like n=1 Tax=Mya arenaria TaxID=6604 RepID=UPI0022E634A2|nr:perlucin-like [Mya arenaria]